MQQKEGRKSINLGMPMGMYNELKIISGLSMDRSVNATINKAVEKYISDNKELLDVYRKNIEKW